MTTHHPNSANGKSPAAPDDYADAMNHLSESARDMQTIHTRLADLLDQVSVSATSEESDPQLPGEDNGSYQGAFPNSYNTTERTEDSVEALGADSTFNSSLTASSTFDASASLDDPNRGLGHTADEIKSEYIASHESDKAAANFENRPFESEFAQNSPSSTDTIESLTSMEEQRFDGIGRNDMPDEDISANTSDLDENSTAATQNSAISIKGRTDGISIEIGAGGWRMLMVQLRQRLHQSSGFFRGGIVSLDVGARSLTHEDLVNAQEVLDEHGLKLGMIRTLSEETSQVAAALGLTVTLDKPAASVSQTASTNHESLAHFVYRGNLRSGQVLRRAETILVLGDVNPGAHVESEADILVWGRLRGIAHAGSTGDVNAIVAAMSMEPTQLRVTDIVAIMPATDEKRSLFGAKKRNPNLAPRPEVAYIADGTIIVEPWDESKPGGIMAFRRS